jgi:hypothetical protein
MKIYYFPVIFTALLLFCCTKGKQTTLFPGLWKMEKIEVFNNDHLRKTIDTGYQYWKFCKTDSILIFERKELQNCLQIKINRNSITSIDRTNRADVFAITLVNKEKLELSSRQKLNEQEYTIVYYLEKVNEENNEEDMFRKN